MGGKQYISVSYTPKSNVLQYTPVNRNTQIRACYRKTPSRDGNRWKNYKSSKLPQSVFLYRSRKKENQLVIGKLLSRPVPQLASWLQPQTAEKSCTKTHPTPAVLLGHLESCQTQFLSYKGRKSFSPDDTNNCIPVENYIHTVKNIHIRKDFYLPITF